MDIKQDLEQVLDEDYSSIISSFPSAVLLAVTFSLAFILGISYYMDKTTKEDKQLSKRIKDILKDGKDWKVMIVKSDSENGFCIGFPVIYLTSGLIKNNKKNPRLVEAIMLHEASHIKNYDTLKMALVTLPGQTILLSILMSTITGPEAGFFRVLAFLLIIISGVFYGRKAETRADNLAIKYGYGSELKEYFEKDKKDEKNKIPKNPIYRKVYKALEKLGELMDVHPKLEKRIKAAASGAKLYNAAKSSSNIKDLSKKIYKIIV